MLGKNDSLRGIEGPSDGEGEEFLFKSSPALQALDIPESPRRTRRTTGSQVVALDPPPKPGSYRWPVAFVLSAGVITGGFLLYAKMNTKAPPAEPTDRPQMIASATAKPPPASTDVDASVDDATIARAPTGAATENGAAPATGAAAGPAETPAPGSRSDHAIPRGAGRRVALAKAQPGAAPGEHGAGSASPAGTTEAPSQGATGEPQAGGEQPATAGTPTAGPGETQPGTATAKKPDTLDRLIEGVLSNASAPAAKPSEAAPAPDAKPEPQLTQAQIREEMRRIGPAVRACYEKYLVAGTARVRLLITNEGKPSDIQIKGKFLGTDTGACVTQAVSQTRFPAYAGRPMTIDFPFILEE